MEIERSSSEFVGDMIMEPKLFRGLQRCQRREVGEALGCPFGKTDTE
jgi:hypothetical protein